MAGGVLRAAYSRDPTVNEHIHQMLAKLLYKKSGSYIARIVGGQTLKITRQERGYACEVREGGKLIQQQEWREWEEEPPCPM
jgi:hypothetical protein